jgi:hypothetical protein
MIVLFLASGGGEVPEQTPFGCCYFERLILAEGRFRGGLPLSLYGVFAHARIKKRHGPESRGAFVKTSDA